MSDTVKEKEYTKISIDKDLHYKVKSICSKDGLKMYHFVNEAIRHYIKSDFSRHITENDKYLS